MLKVSQIDHVVLRTTRIEAMMAFYIDIIGCQVERSNEEIGLTQLKAGSSLIDLVTVDGQLGILGGDAPKPLGNNMDHFCLRLETISPEELKAYLEDQGVEMVEFGKRYGAEGLGYSVYIKDPDGNNLELRSELQRA